MVDERLTLAVQAHVRCNGRVPNPSPGPGPAPNPNPHHAPVGVLVLRWAREVCCETVHYRGSLPSPIRVRVRVRVRGRGRISVRFRVRVRVRLSVRVRVRWGDLFPHMHACMQLQGRVSGTRFNEGGVIVMHARKGVRHAV